MKIGFDVSPLRRPHPPGVARATRGLVDALERRGRVQVVRLEPEPRVALARWRARGIPDAVRALRLDLVHSPVSAFAPFGPGRRVQTIHEIPWLAGASENADWRHRAWAAVGPLLAQRVVCPTETTAGHVRVLSPLAASKVRACPWGVDDAFTREPRDDERVLERLGLDDRPFVLCAGAVRAKKNLGAAIRGVARVNALARAGVEIVVTGERTLDLVADLALAEELGVRVRAVGLVDDSTLAALTRGARAALVLSRSEGFGFPVIEAQACGTPAIVPRSGAQVEIAGEAGIRVDPEDADDVARAIASACADRRGLAARGCSHAARFTWDACAERVERVFEEIA